MKTLITKAAEIIEHAESVFVLSGAGVSAESGIPTFRGADGLWKNYAATDLATPEAFQRNPELVWEWYHWRQCIILKAQPNAAHHAIVELERRSKKFLLLTQNVDNLHRRAGSQNVLELHGNIFRTRCTRCGKVIESEKKESSTVCHCEERTCLEAHRESDDAISRRIEKHNEIATPLDELGARNDRGTFRTAPSKQSYDLPRCGCGGVLRPDVVWFGESIPQDIWQASIEFVATADVALICGTSSVVWPAAAIPEIAQRGGAKTIEVNLEPTQVSALVNVSLMGKAGDILPQIVETL